MIISTQTLREVLNGSCVTQIMLCSVLLWYVTNIPTPSVQLGEKILHGIDSQVFIATAMLNTDLKNLNLSIALDI